MNNNKITKLPDGSAFFTTTIMSKEEAMKLPLKNVHYAIVFQMKYILLYFKV